MSKRTFCIDSPADDKSTVRRIFTGVKVSDDQNSVYHSYHADSDIIALTVSDKENKILKKDGRIETCKVELDYEWKSEYEIYLYCLPIENSDDTYVVCNGALNNSISIEDSENVEINIEGTSASLSFNYEEYYGWAYGSSAADPIADSFDVHSGRIVADKFSKNSDVVRIGFDKEMPEALEVKYYSPK